MCLGVPGRIVEIGDHGPVLMAVVDFGGATKEICLAYTPDAGPGQYVIVHAGFAIATLDEDAARASLALFDEIAASDAGPDAADRKELP